MQRTVLIIDDEKNLTDLIAHHLKAKGYQTVIAQNGQEGLQKLQVIIPDLIILDINMPVMNGLEFYRQITTDFGRVRFPVLVLTSRKELEKTFSDIQAAGFLPKPFLIEDLIREVEKITAGFSKPMVYLTAFVENQHIAKIGEVLIREQYEVCYIKDFEDLKEQAERTTPQAIILEYGQNGPSGAEILQAVKNTTGLSHCPVIAYSYSGYEELESESLKAGADKYLSAPSRYEIFIEALRELKLKQVENSSNHDSGRSN